MAKRVVVGRTTTPKMKMKQGPAAGASRGELAKRKEVRAKIGKKLPDEEKIRVFKLRDDTTLGKERVEKLSKPRTVKAPSQGPEFSRTGTRPPQYVAKQQNSDDAEQSSSIARREGGKTPGTESAKDDIALPHLPGGRNHPMFARGGKAPRDAHAAAYKNVGEKFGGPSKTKTWNPKLKIRNEEHAALTEHFVGLGARMIHGAKQEAVRQSQHRLIAQHGLPRAGATICSTPGCVHTNEGAANCGDAGQNCKVVTNTKAASGAVQGQRRARSVSTPVFSSGS